VKRGVGDTLTSTGTIYEKILFTSSRYYTQHFKDCYSVYFHIDNNSADLHLWFIPTTSVQAKNLLNEAKVIWQPVLSQFGSAMLIVNRH
jgi:hypothetical protein